MPGSGALVSGCASMSVWGWAMAWLAMRATTLESRICAHACVFAQLPFCQLLLFGCCVCVQPCKQVCVRCWGLSCVRVQSV